MKKRPTSILEKYLVVLSPRLQTHTPVTSLMRSSVVYFTTVVAEEVAAVVVVAELVVFLFIG